MKKLNLLKSLIITMAVLLGTVDKAFCEATAVQQSRTVVQSTVVVEKTSEPEIGYINTSSGGEASTLISTFKLQANDEKTFFVVYSNIQVDGEQTTSAFDGAGNLLFGNTSILPTGEDVKNAKAGVSGNANVIAYPFVLNGENIEATSAVSETYKECYKVILEDPLTFGTLTQTVGGTPAPNTFSTRDQAGTYKATVYVSAVTEL